MPRLLSRLARLLRPGLPAPAVGRQAKRTRRARPRDFQRTRVYRWEADHVFPRVEAEPLSLAACRGLVEAAYLWAEAPAPGAPWRGPPEVTDGRGRRHACGSRDVIKLPRWARTRAVVLHECAHGLAPDLHGPGFVAAYVALLARFAGLDEGDLRARLAGAGVRVAERSGLPR